MRIAMVSQFMPPFVGGIQTHIAMLSAKLRSRGHTVHWIEGAPAGVGPLRFLPRVLPNLQAYDIVHFHGFERLLFAATLRAGPRNLIVTPHGGLAAPAALPGAANKIKMTLDSRWLKSILISKAKAIIALHNAERASLVGGCTIAAHVVTVPNGLDIQPTVGARTFASIPYAIFVGRVVNLKRLDLAIEALALTSGIDLRIVGPVAPPLRIKLQKTAKNAGVVNRVHFMGRKEGDELRDLQRNAIANVVLSDYDHQPLSILEAAALGTPTIARPMAGIPEIAKDLGQLITLVESRDDVAAALKRYAEREPTVVRLDFLSPLAAKYSWDVVADKIEEIYRRAASA